MLFAPPPAWWASRGATQTGLAADDFAAANIGQLKQFASKAVEELEASLPSGAGSVLTDMVARWHTPPEQLNPPGPPRDDFAAANLGQLKAIAKPFYDRLIAVGYATTYPWTAPITDDDDFAIANLGQLKKVFSFDVAKDTDGDGIPDWWETLYANLGLNPQNPNDAGQTAAGGVTYLNKFLLNLNPAVADTDGDGMTDLYEMDNGLNPLVNDAALDKDSDGLTNLQEFNLGTKANNHDSDGDLLPDGWEVRWGLDPSSAVGADGADGDPDGDGLTNLNEYLNGSNPWSADSDSDGTNDQVEVTQGSNPNDGTDGGAAPPADEMVEVPFKIGGDWAAWEMTVTGQGPQDQRVQKLVTNTPGETDGKNLKLRRGNKYEIRMRWLKSREGEPLTWWCWEASVDNLPTGQTFPDYSTTRNAGVAEAFMAANHWLVDNADGLLTAHTHMKQGALFINAHMRQPFEFPPPEPAPDRPIHDPLHRVPVQPE